MMSSTKQSSPTKRPNQIITVIHDRNHIFWFHDTNSSWFVLISSNQVHKKLSCTTKMYQVQMHIFSETKNTFKVLLTSMSSIHWNMIKLISISSTSFLTHFISLLQQVMWVFSKNKVKTIFVFNKLKTVKDKFPSNLVKLELNGINNGNLVALKTNVLDYLRLHRQQPS